MHLSRTNQRVMEWLNLCGLLSRKATDPPNQIAWGILGGTVGFLGSTGTLAVLKPQFTPLPAVLCVVGYQAYITYGLPKAPNQDKYGRDGTGGGGGGGPVSLHRTTRSRTRRSSARSPGRSSRRGLPNPHPVDRQISCTQEQAS